MRFTINIATRMYLDHRLVNQVCTALLVILLALLAWNIGRVASGIGELRDLRTDSATMEARLNSRPAGVSEKDYTRMLASIKFYNEVINQKSYNWIGFLELVENATPEGVALSLLAPDKNGKALRIEGRAKSFADVRKYLERLDDSKSFSDILLLSHKDVTMGEKTKGVQFAISCRAVSR